MKKLTLLFLLLCTNAFASNYPDEVNLPKEKFYLEWWCLDQGGKPYFNLKDYVRIDCLTENEAVEVDFAYKWREALGQAMYYSFLTGKTGSMLLIGVTGIDEKFIDRAHQTVLYFGINIKIYAIWDR